MQASYKVVVVAPPTATSGRRTLEVLYVRAASPTEAGDRVRSSRPGLEVTPEG